MRIRIDAYTDGSPDHPQRVVVDVEPRYRLLLADRESLKQCLKRHPSVRAALGDAGWVEIHDLCDVTTTSTTTTSTTNRKALA